MQNLPRVAKELFGPYPGALTTFLARAVFAVERRIQIILRRLTFPAGRSNGWNWTDGFFTPHDKSFLMDETFVRAYRAAVEFVGSDFRIPWRVHQAIWCARNAVSFGGDFIELGTGRGFVMCAVLNAMSQEIRPTSSVLLCDVFATAEVSGVGMTKHSESYAESSGPIREYFARWPQVEVVEGDVRQTIPRLNNKSFSFVHVDLNDGTTEVEVLQNLWPRLTSPAIILLDDYANNGMAETRWQLGAFFDQKSLPVLTTAAGQGIVLVP